MGGGAWSSNTYDARLRSKRAAGYSTPFTHTADIASGRTAVGVHESLDPKWTAGDTSPNAGKVIREAHDSDEHPESLPIVVGFDVTGSMRDLPGLLQQKLPALHGLLVRKGYAEHPQICFAAIGDAYSDRVPLQIGQFEADNKGDEQLENVYLEGGGGGGNHESYQLLAYYMARHTDLHSLDKRGKKGYFFTIGDERLYDSVDFAQVKSLIGDELAQSLTTKEVFDELKQRFEVYHLFAAQGSYREDQVLPESAAGGGALGWRSLLGENALVLDDANAVCELIALTIGVMEGAVSLEDGIDEVAAETGDANAAKAAGKALAAVGGGSAAVAEASGDLPAVNEGDGGTERL